jgi:hypothetical protein
VAEYSQYVSIVAAIGITGSTVLANGQFFEKKFCAFWLQDSF